MRWDGTGKRKIFFVFSCCIGHEWSNERWDDVKSWISIFFSLFSLPDFTFLFWAPIVGASPLPLRIDEGRVKSQSLPKDQGYAGVCLNEFGPRGNCDTKNNDL
jgi:hypothetical protein